MSSDIPHTLSEEILYTARNNVTTIKLVEATLTSVAAILGPKLSHGADLTMTKLKKNYQVNPTVKAVD